MGAEAEGAKRKKQEQAPNTLAMKFFGRKKSAKEKPEEVKASGVTTQKRAQDSAASEVGSSASLDDMQREVERLQEELVCVWEWGGG